MYYAVYTRIMKDINEMTRDEIIESISNVNGAIELINDKEELLAAEEYKEDLEYALTHNFPKLI